MRDALQRSGYLLEYRVEELLRRCGYMVEANQSYPDPITGKSRELDIAAISAEPLNDAYRDILWPRLLIECVNNTQPMAFLTKSSMAPTAHIYDLKFSGVPLKIKSNKRWVKLADFLKMERYHHHCKGRVATQFCSFTPKKNTQPLQWLAQHKDIHFDSFNKLCFALNHDIDEHFSNAKLVGKESLNIQMYYQILVVACDLVDVFPTKDALKLSDANHIHFIQSHVARGKEQRYHIDVVTEKFLPKLLGLIDAEAKKTAQLLKRHSAPQ